MPDNWHREPHHWRLVLFGSAAIDVKQFHDGWRVYVADERLPEVFESAESAAQAGMDFAKRRMYEALTRIG
jgi:hypothetical protein